MSNLPLKTLSIKSVPHLCAQLGTSQRELDHICQNIHQYYRNFSKQDAKGKIREFNTPRGRLREILDRLSKILQRIQLPDSIHGGRKGKSTKSNAGPHVNKPKVDTYDITNFFPSVPYRRVYELFNSRLKCSPDVARYLTRLTTYKGRIPQGSPTSTIVASLVAEPLALRLQSLAEKHGGDFSQYVDDITFSGPSHITKLENLIDKIVRQEGFKINPDKTKHMSAGQEQIVTGIRVNSTKDAPRKKIQEVKMLLDQFKANGTVPTNNQLQSIKGKIQYISSLNKGAGNYLRKRLELITPPRRVK